MSECQVRPRPDSGCPGRPRLLVVCPVDLFLSVCVGDSLSVSGCVCVCVSSSWLCMWVCVVVITCDCAAAKCVFHQTTKLLPLFLTSWFFYSYHIDS